MSVGAEIARHLHIHQHQVGTGRLELLDRDPAVFRDLDAVGKLLQVCLDEKAIVGRILGEQDAQRDSIAARAPKAREFQSLRSVSMKRELLLPGCNGRSARRI